MRIFTSVVLHAGVVLASACLAPQAAHAQSARYAVLIQGASGEEQYAKQHRAWLDSLASVLRDRFKYDASHLLVFAEQPQPGEERSTAAAIRGALAKLASTVAPADQVALVFIGHGGGQGPDAKFNLIGPDLSVAEWADLLNPIRGRIAVVDTTSASFPYLAGLSGEGRVIITATSSFAQRFHTTFPEGFIQAFTTEAADSDKNGRISLLEAFDHASRVVKQFYEQKGTMATEVAALDDDGDGKGRDAATNGPDGAVAALTYLDAPVMQTSADPETQKLLKQQQTLTEQVDDLRRRQTTMPAAEYEREFERLMGELAVVSREVRRRTGG